MLLSSDNNDQTPMPGASSEHRMHLLFNTARKFIKLTAWAIVVLIVVAIMRSN